VKSPRVVGGFTLPGHESYPENNKSIKMLEAAIQRLTNLCSILNDMEPICVINHVFVLREVSLLDFKFGRKTYIWLNSFRIYARILSGKFSCFLSVL
jgi:hypothetical protein